MTIEMRRPVAHLTAEMRTAAFAFDPQVRRILSDFAAKCVARPTDFCPIPSLARRNRRPVVIDKSDRFWRTWGRLRQALDATEDPQIRRSIADLWIKRFGTRVPNREVELRDWPTPSRRDGIRDLALAPGAGEQRRSVEIRHRAADLVEKSASHRPTFRAAS